MVILEIVDDHRNAIEKRVSKEWGSSDIISRGILYKIHELPGLIARDGNKTVGILTYKIKNKKCEIVFLNTYRKTSGIGSSLLMAMVEKADELLLEKLNVIITNDNLDALRFLQKRNFHISAVYRNAVTISRSLKPGIPRLGCYDIPVRDELELVYQI